MSGGDEFDRALADAVAAGRAAWPGIEVPADEFAAYLVARLPAPATPEAVRAMPAGDLFLALACVRGDGRAVAALDQRFLASLPAQLSHRRGFPALDEDAMQRLRARLLVADGTTPPRLSRYRGAGPLGAWLFVTAARLALEGPRAAAAALPGDDELVRRLCSPEVDPELGYLKGRYTQELEAALREALGALPAREASVLRLHFLEGTTSDAVARMYGVTRRTVHRWLLEARERLIAGIHARLQQRLAVSPSEFRSLVGLVQSQVDPSLARALPDSNDVNDVKDV